MTSPARAQQVARARVAIGRRDGGRDNGVLDRKEQEI
jgi:hypothetical protein